MKRAYRAANTSPATARLTLRRPFAQSCGLKSTALPLKTLCHFGRTSAYPSLLQSHTFTTSCPLPTSNMSKSSKTPAVSADPPRWQLVSWQKKHEQYARIPHAWRLPSLPPSNVTNYTDIPRKCGILNNQEISITEEYDATALAEAIRARKLKCIDVTRAFCKV
jgi:hypothetical protein